MTHARRCLVSIAILAALAQPARAERTLSTVVVPEGATLIAAGEAELSVILLCGGFLYRQEFIVSSPFSSSHDRETLGTDFVAAQGDRYRVASSLSCGSGWVISDLVPGSAAAPPVAVRAPIYPGNSVVHALGPARSVSSPVICNGAYFGFDQRLAIPDDHDPATSRVNLVDVESSAPLEMGQRYVAGPPTACENQYVFTLYPID